MKREEWVRKMRKLYREVKQQYLDKGYNETKADFIAGRVVTKLSKKRGIDITRTEIEGGNT